MGNAGAKGETRTLKGFNPLEPKSSASTNFATFAKVVNYTAILS